MAEQCILPGESADFLGIVWGKKLVLKTLNGKEQA